MTNPMNRELNPPIPPAVERYLDRLAALGPADWRALAERAQRPRPGILEFVDRLRATSEYFRAVRGGTIPPIVRANASWQLKRIVETAEPRPSLAAYKVAQDGLTALLLRRATSEEFFERAYAPVSEVIPLDTVA